MGVQGGGIVGGRQTWESVCVGADAPVGLCGFFHVILYPCGACFRCALVSGVPRDATGAAVVHSALPTALRRRSKVVFLSQRFNETLLCYTTMTLAEEVEWWGGAIMGLVCRCGSATGARRPLKAVFGQHEGVGAGKG